MKRKTLHRKTWDAAQWRLAHGARYLSAHLAIITAISCCVFLPMAGSAFAATDAATDKAADAAGMSAQPNENASANAHVHLHADEIVDDPDIAVNTEIGDSETSAKKDKAKNTKTQKAADKPAANKPANDKSAKEKNESKKDESKKTENKNVEIKKADSKKSESPRKAKGDKPPKVKAAPGDTQTAAKQNREPTRDNKATPETDSAPTPAPETATAPPATGNPVDTSEAKDHYPDKDSAIDFASAGNALREQAARYRSLTDHWNPIAPGGPLKPGDNGPRVAQLRKLLQQFGDYTGQPGPVTASREDRQRFDAGLQLAVESYQRRHGMQATGRVDRATLREMARPPQELARLLELNAERWDKLPAAPGNRYIFVNVPDYQLQLVDQRKVVLSMKTVVGKSSKRTPEMNTKVVSVVFNPTWTVPRSILLTDLLPKARNNPEAMHKRGYRVVKYGTNTTTPISEKSIESAASGEATLRQISGPGNTLGRVKFVIPNKQAIFLHDTQAQSLFEQPQRAFSHGCIRLQQPEELAYALLGPQGWDRTQVAQATTGDQSVTIKVENPPKLFITYLTAWVDTLGRVQFRPDIYHRDRREL